MGWPISYTLSVTVALLVPTQAAWVRLLQGMPVYGVGSSVVERRFVVPHVGSSILLLHPSLCVISSVVVALP